MAPTRVCLTSNWSSGITFRTVLFQHHPHLSKPPKIKCFGAAHNGSVVRQLPRKMIKIENTQLSSINYWKKTYIEEITLKLPKNKNKTARLSLFNFYMPSDRAKTSGVARTNRVSLVVLIVYNQNSMEDIIAHSGLLMTKNEYIG